MELKDGILLYILLLPIFFLLDMLWIGFVANSMYKNDLSHLIRKKVNGGIDVLWIPATIFYLVYLASSIFFVIARVGDGESVFKVFAYGAFLGFSMYATYDLTNLATIKNWPLKVTVIDLAWGTFLTGIVSLIGFLLYTNVL